MHTQVMERCPPEGEVAGASASRTLACVLHVQKRGVMLMAANMIASKSVEACLG